MVRQERGDFAAAENLMRRVLELRERYSAPPTIQELRSQAEQPRRRPPFNGARDSEADPLLRRALTIVEEPLSTGDQRTRAAILNSLGLTLLNLGEKARAEPVLRRAVALFKLSGGADSLDAAKALNNLGVLHRATHEYATAEQELKQALPMYRQQLGDNHPQLIALLGNLFSVLAEQKRFAEGEPYLRRAMEIAARNRGEISPASVLLLRVDLAALEDRTAETTRALRRFFRAVIPGTGASVRFGSSPTRRDAGKLCGRAAPLARSEVAVGETNRFACERDSKVVPLMDGPVISFALVGQVEILPHTSKQMSGTGH